MWCSGLWLIFAYCVLASVFAVVSLSSGESEVSGCNATLEVRVTGIGSDDGVVRISLFNSRDRWDARQGAYVNLVVRPEKGAAVGMFRKIPPGVYGIMLYHDENGNDRLDFNSIGLPAESYGFSNNVRPLFSFPSFESVSFNVHCGKSLVEIALE
jgi:uncharacterized protein (DUF2141 family)